MTWAHEFSRRYKTTDGDHLGLLGVPTFTDTRVDKIRVGGTDLPSIRPYSDFSCKDLGSISTGPEDPRSTSTEPRRGTSVVNVYTKGRQNSGPPVPSLLPSRQRSCSGICHLRRRTIKGRTPCSKRNVNIHIGVMCVGHKHRD